MLEKYSNLFDKDIYKISLVSISSDSNVYMDLSRKENILNMKEEIVKEIFVQKTASSNYVREIITGMLIPVRREFVSINDFYYEELGHWWNIDKVYFAINKSNSPTYVKIVKNKNDFFLYGYYLYHYKPLAFFGARVKDIYNYVAEHMDENKWKSELENIFLEGERKYQELLDKNEISNNRKANSKLVKKLKKDN